VRRSEFSAWCIGARAPMWDAETGEINKEHDHEILIAEIVFPR